MKNDKKTLILTIIAVLALIAVVGGATYAYFAADLGGGSSANLNATTGTTDSLSFTTGDKIWIHADTENFAKDKENLTDSTTATATLKPNNTTNQAEAKYNIFFIIDDNNFKYATADKTPELILKVTDSEGNVVTSITGLKGNDGEFDITERSGAYLIAKDYAIAADTIEGTVQTWNVEVTLINLDANQNANMGKALNGTIYITTEDEETYKLPEINKIEATTTYSSIRANLEVTQGTSEIDKYYFGKEEVNSTTAYVNTKVMRLSNRLAANSEIEYIETTNPSYEFTDLKDNATYKIYSYAIDKNGLKSNTYETEITTDNYVLPSIKSITKEVTTDSIKVVVIGESGSNEIVKYYYSKDNGATYQESTSNEYTFTSLESGIEYKIKIQVEDANKRKSTEYYEGISTELNLSETDKFIETIYTGTQGEGGLYYHDSTLANGAGDNSYRYAGANPNNYLCFGYDDTTGVYASNWCPANNSYRIIGVFNVAEEGELAEYQIKLIKRTSLGTGYWRGSSSINSNVWANSTLNTGMLNGTYLNNIGTEWASKIANHIWQVRGMTWPNAGGAVVKTAYQYEVGANRANTTYEAKIGLMYVSDYGYAATPANWTTNLTNYKNSTNTNNNWLYLGVDEWTISRSLDNSYSAFYVNSDGRVNSGDVSSLSYAILPSFYLEPSVKIFGGTGTSSDPYRISI